MKVRMLLKSGLGSIRHGEIFDAAPDDARLGLQAGFLAPVDAEPTALASPERPRPENDRPRPEATPHNSGKSIADFCRAVNRLDCPYLARHYDSHFVPPETDHLSPREKAALAESGGPTGGYTVPAEYASRMMTVAAENAVVRPSATVAPMQSATLQVPYIDMTTPQAAGVSPYIGGVQMKWTGEAQTRTETEPPFKQVELKAWDLSGSALGTKGDLILIDPLYDLIGDRSQATIAASDHVNFQKNQVTLRVTRRCDGQSWIDKPITLQDGTTTASPFVVLV